MSSGRQLTNPENSIRRAEIYFYIEKKYKEGLMANMGGNNMGSSNKGQGNQLRCQQCNQQFENQQRLDEHNRQMHQNR